ncbi:hypothetical protein, partial [Klebsiella pneumoniae]|uniref:hypothetical protein n=1 Tax=Klebsiella pneumoniae TaxID=573 RepID=UPI003EBE760A
STIAASTHQPVSSMLRRVSIAYPELYSPYSSQSLPHSAQQLLRRKKLTVFLLGEDNARQDVQQ